eukprot:10138961-Alexandrium_andersonii.AAC.1
MEIAELQKALREAHDGVAATGRAGRQQCTPGEAGPNCPSRTSTPPPRDRAAKDAQRRRLPTSNIASFPTNEAAARGDWSCGLATPTARRSGLHSSLCRWGDPRQLMSGDRCCSGKNMTSIGHARQNTDRAIRLRMTSLARRSRQLLHA